MLYQRFEVYLSAPTFLLTSDGHSFNWILTLSKYCNIEDHVKLNGFFYSALRVNEKSVQNITV